MANVNIKNVNVKGGCALFLSVAYTLLSLLGVPASAVYAQEAVSTTARGYIALVVNGGDSTVSAVDIDTGIIIQTIPFSNNVDGGSATCIVTTPDNSLALVTYNRKGSHRVIVLDTAAIGDGVENNEKIAELPLQQTDTEGGTCIAVTPDSTSAYVTGSSNASGIAVIDIARVRDNISNNEVSWIDMGAAAFHSIVITPDGSRAYVTDDGFANSVYVFDIDPASPTFNTNIAQIDVMHNGTFLKAIAITSDGTRIYVSDSTFLNKIFVIDTNPGSSTYHTVLHEIDLNRAPLGLITSADSKRLYVSKTDEILLFDIDVESPTLYDFVDRVVPNMDGFFGVGTMALTRDGDTLIALRSTKANMSIIDTASGIERKRIAVGNRPSSVALYRAPVPNDHIQVADEANVPVRGGGCLPKREIAWYKR